MAVDLGLTERECCAQAALADDWQKTAILYAAEIEVLRAKLKTCENTARLNLKVATDRGAENGCLKATVMSLEKTILEDHFASPKIRELVVLSEEAADEIERLQKDNKHWQEIASQRIGIERTLRIEIERLQDEVEYWKHADNKRETP